MPVTPLAFMDMPWADRGGLEGPDFWNSGRKRPLLTGVFDTGFENR